MRKTADRAAVLLWAADKLDESERLRDLTDDHMHDVHAAANELRRLAAEAQQQEPEAPREWCKCRSCWGWFVEEHPGEDLDELGRDLGWWSGLPEHRDAPDGAQQQCPTACDPDCDAACHELHQPPRKRDHQPDDHGAGAQQQPDTEAPCPGFPDACPNPVAVPPSSPYHGGGTRCGCADRPASPPV